MSTFCIQMELCGKNLRQWLNAQSIDNPQLKLVQHKIVQGLATGLNYLHENNIMHRDFRPENIMFTYSPTEEFALQIKIGDFGLCRKIHSENTKTSTLTCRAGHELYRAPETVGSDYGKQSDLFSFGLVIWEVMQLLKFEKIGRMFYKLVQENETDLITFKQYFIKNAVISLTRWRIRKRAMNIYRYLISVYSQGLIIVGNNDEM